MIGRVRSGDENRIPPARRRSGKGGLSHSQQAHLTSAVEAVLVEHGDGWPMLVERRGPLRLDSASIASNSDTASGRARSR